MHLANKRTKCTTKVTNYNNNNSDYNNNNTTNNHDIHGDSDGVAHSDADVDADFQVCPHI